MYAYDPSMIIEHHFCLQKYVYISLQNVPFDSRAERLNKVSKHPITKKTFDIQLKNANVIIVKAQSNK